MEVVKFFFYYCHGVAMNILIDISIGFHVEPPALGADHLFLCFPINTKLLYFNMILIFIFFYLWTFVHTYVGHLFSCSVNCPFWFFAHFLFFLIHLCQLLVFTGFPGGSDSKESASNVGDLGLIPGSGRSPGEGIGNPLHHSCLGNPMDRGAWQTTVHGVANSWTQLND